MRALSFAAEKVSETVGLPRLSAAPASFLPLLWLRQPQRVPLAFFAAALLAGCSLALAYERPTAPVSVRRSLVMLLRPSG